MARNSLLTTNANVTLDDVVKWAETNAVYCIDDNRDVSAETLGDVKCIIKNGTAFIYDPTAGAGTPVDPVTLKSADSRVYRAANPNRAGNAYIENVNSAVNSEPARKVAGTTYIIHSPTNTYTDLWASDRVNFFAYWNGQKWLFFRPDDGKKVYNRQTQTDWQFRVGQWNEGVHGFSITDRTVPITVLTMPYGAHVLQLGLNTPPASPNNGDSYIVAASNTSGVFNGLENRFVQFWNGSWRVGERNYIGARVYDREDGRHYEWNGTNWERLDITLLESYAGPVGGHGTATATVIGTGDTARSGWILDAGGFLPPLRRSGDWIEIEQLDGTHAIQFEASDQGPPALTRTVVKPTRGNDVPYGVPQQPLQGNGEFAVQSTTQTVNGAREANPQIFFKYKLVLMVGNSSTIYATIGQGDGTIVNWRDSQHLNGRRNPDTKYTYNNIFLPQYNQPLDGTPENERPGSLYHAAYDAAIISPIGENGTRQRTAILQGNTNDQIRLVILMDEVQRGFAGRILPSGTTQPRYATDINNGDLAVNPDISVSARNIHINIKYKYFTNSFS